MKLVARCVEGKRNDRGKRTDACVAATGAKSPCARVTATKGTNACATVEERPFRAA
jgi:hypothetical protein